MTYTFSFSQLLYYLAESEDFILIFSLPKFRLFLHSAAAAAAAVAFISIYHLTFSATQPSIHRHIYTHTYMPVFTYMCALMCVGIFAILTQSNLRLTHFFKFFETKFMYHVKSNFFIFEIYLLPLSR